MGKRLSQIWQQFRQLFSVSETVNTSLETGKAVLEAAKTLQENSSLDILKPVLQNSSSLLDVLCSPMAQVVGAGLPFVGLGIALLKFAREISKQDPSLEDCVLIVCQAAYLESIKEIFQRHKNINWDGNFDFKKVSQELHKLSNFELDYDTARDAILCFRTSELSAQFNKVLSARLETTEVDHNGQNFKLPQDFIDRIIQRVSWQTHHYIIKACITSGDILNNIPQPSFGEWRQEEQKFQSINKYLKEYIDQQPLERVFEEKFTLRDIYVPSQAKQIDSNSKETGEAFDLQTWAKNILEQATANKPSQVIFIQAGPGKGKSVFCRMFASWVRINLHPVWTPILIRLRDIKTFEKDFEHTLRAAVDRDFAKNDQGWLNDCNTRFLFLLDGFDELVLERKTSEGLKDFLNQVSAFQQRCGKNSEKGHQVLITGRPLALQGIERVMPDNLNRVEIQLMDDSTQEQWLNKWSNLVGADKKVAFEQFLKNDNCPERVRELSKEPLLLYLLAAMHRDGEITIEMFKNAQGTQARILIYQKTIDWVLTKQRPASLNREIAELETKDLRRILKDTGLCVIQCGGEIAPVTMIEERVKDNKNAQALIEQARNSKDDNPLRQALATFYIKQTANKDGSVEFAHKSFGEFLFAENLAEKIEDWTLPGKRDKEFDIETEQMDKQIYDLLGYGGLTSEMVEYLMGLLKKSQEFQPIKLFQRLHDFYLRWCNGEFIDAVTITLPQLKAQQLQKYDIQLGQRQVDVYAGLNVMILLLELHRYSQGRDDLKEEIVFYPSGKPQENSWTSQLLKIINYSNGVELWNFAKIVRQFLSGADLSGADLSGAVLSGADLGGADLRGAYLIHADLNGAYLIHADLGGAYLRGAVLRGAYLIHAVLIHAVLIHADLIHAGLIHADLSDADLSDADLIHADLSGANLSGANLSGANLSGANLSGANLSDDNSGDIKWDEKTNWENVRGLKTAKNVPEALKQQLKLNCG